MKYNKLMAENSDKAMYMAVEGCFLTIQSAHMRSKRLRVYKGGEHENAAQKPEVWTGEIK